MDDQSKLAYQDLRKMIEAGTFRMSERVQEAKLARELDYSRTPIRAALNCLEHEGFLTYEPNKGHIMSTYTVADIEEIYRCRSVLEAEAAYLAARNGLSDRAGQLIESLTAQMQELVESDELPASKKRERFLRLNKKFHDTIYLACGNSRLLDMIVKTSGLPLVIRNYYGFTDVALQSSQRDHLEISRLLLAGDAARVKTRVRQHILKASECMLANPVYQKQ